MEERNTCHDCGVKEGEFHIPGCDMERCPFCGRQLISCNCCYEKLGLIDHKKYPDTFGLPPDVYFNGLSDEQAEEYEEILREEGLIPYIVYPNMCAICGKLWPDMFKVSNEEWEHYVEPAMRNSMLCISCYKKIVSWIDETNPYEGPKSFRRIDYREELQTDMSQRK